VRPASFESPSEAEFLKGLFSGRDSELRNTVFALLGPDGKKRLGPTGRSPSFVFEDAEQMAAEMDKLAELFDGQTKRSEPPLPLIGNLRLALNIAACDRRPLIIGVASKNRDADTWRKRLSLAAQDEALIGQAHYVCVRDLKSLQPFDLKLDPARDTHMIQPGPYGRTGTVMGAFDSQDPQLSTHLKSAITTVLWSPLRESQHVRTGKITGITWETVVPTAKAGPKARGGLQNPRDPDEE
jgi:hypothetical protein